MLHLAQIQKSDQPGRIGLGLLAVQASESAWTLLSGNTLVLSDAIEAWGMHQLVLVDLSEHQEVLSIEDAKGWVMALVKNYLANGVTPSFLQQETERAEQWRQSLTLQSQELDRRALELEARREQIQELEETLKRDRKELDQHR
jgi:hypothetical protein